MVGAYCLGPSRTEDLGFPDWAQSLPAPTAPRGPGAGSAALLLAYELGSLRTPRTDPRPSASPIAPTTPFRPALCSNCLPHLHTPRPSTRLVSVGGN